MQAVVLTGLGVMAMILAGCGQPGPAKGDGRTLSDASESAAPLPSPLRETGTLSASFDLIGGDPISCSAGSCHRYPIVLPRNSTLSAFLQWGDPAQDVELYLAIANGSIRLASSDADATRHEFFRITVGAGAYDLVVTGAATANIDYIVWAWFDEPADPANDLSFSARRDDP